MDISACSPMRTHVHMPSSRHRVRWTQLPASKPVTSPGRLFGRASERGKPVGKRSSIADVSVLSAHPVASLVRGPFGAATRRCPGLRQDSGRGLSPNSVLGSPSAVASTSALKSGNFDDFISHRSRRTEAELITRLLGRLRSRRITSGISATASRSVSTPEAVF